jgi:hypothetical protein
MIRMFVRHEVSDYGKWRQAYDAFDAERRAMGVKAAAVYRSAEKEGDVTVTHDFDSIDAAKALAASPRLREVMVAAGVLGAPAVWFTTLA